MAESVSPTTEDMKLLAKAGGIAVGRSMGEVLDDKAFELMFDQWLAKEKATVLREAATRFERAADYRAATTLRALADIIEAS